MRKQKYPPVTPGKRLCPYGQWPGQMPKEVVMRICIPTDFPRGKESMVYGHFGSAPYFIIYDDENENLEVLDNSNQHHQHGNCHPIEAIGDKKVSFVVCRGMGARAIQGLNAAGIKVLISNTATVDETIRAFKQNTLTEMTLDDSCGHHQHGCH
jgi:predicted Fe-Mo cluster-binding NifX family protein